MDSLNPMQRAQALSDMAHRDYDVLVIGGGVTGAGIALDAASRGLSTAVVEAQDWGAGTSSRSSRLVHGGLRYLYQLDLKLVSEALRERGLLLTRLAPHLVKPQPLLWPFKTRVIERAYSALGVGLYDVMALIGARGRTVPLQHHVTKSGAKRLFPGLRDDYLVGALVYHDAKVDDARLVVTLMRTALQFGATAASRTQVVRLTKNPAGRVNGADLVDLETGRELHVEARSVINATGVWTERTQDLADAKGGLKVLASKGIHIVVPKDRIDASVGAFLRTEKSVLFMIPWDRYWMIGTTDTAWHEQLEQPVATSQDIDYLLAEANKVLDPPLTRDDVIATWAGLRPLLQPGVLDETASTKVSREHTCTEAAPGLTVIAGGKLTTYRVMARDAVDFAIGKSRAKKLPSITADVPLVGAVGLAAARDRLAGLASRHGLGPQWLDHLLGRYGSQAATVLAMIDASPDLGLPLQGAQSYLRAEVAFACAHEGALHLEDILARRIRLETENADHGLEAAEEIAAIAAPLLDWTPATTARELAAYRARVADEEAAIETATDAQASRIRTSTPELVPWRNA